MFLDDFSLSAKEDDGVSLFQVDFVGQEGIGHAACISNDQSVLVGSDFCQ